MFYEHRSMPPISGRLFMARMIRHGGYAAVLVGISIVVGSAGYHWFAGAAWIDGFLNACMLLGGMGPVGDITPAAGKIFAAFFALYAGLVFLAVATLLTAPVFHRLIHKFHWDAEHASKKS
jgi:hypothetical protein